MGMAKCDVLVVGGGPAGLAAAEAAAGAGARVLVAEKMPSVGRKFLMAGRSGLNLTKDEAAEVFRGAVTTGIAGVRAALEAFGPGDAVGWAEGLGQEVFTGSSGRVFPRAMKASPLLRAWLGRLDGLGVEVRTRCRWEGFSDGRPVLDGEPVEAGAVVIAAGGASWSRLGSDGAWVGPLGAEVVPFSPSNMGFDVDWSEHMARHFGAPAKPVRLRVGAREVVGEFVVSARGIEGSAVYAVSRDLLAGGGLMVDLVPDLDVAEVARRLSRPRGKASMANHLRKVLGLTGVRAALLREAGPLPGEADALAARIKAVPVAVRGPRPLDEAISVSGGVAAGALGGELMLRDRPGVFCAGEMLDWDAPTGGYLITTCLATGFHAGRAAARWARRG